MLSIDSNILVYAEGVGDEDRKAAARSLLDPARRVGLVIPAQVLAETFRVLVRKARLPPTIVRERLAEYQRTVSIVPTSAATLTSAIDLATEHRFQIFDAVILAASAEAGCRLLLSEDMQDGFVWRGVTVVNPFAATPHPMLVDLMRG